MKILYSNKAITSLLIIFLLQVCPVLPQIPDENNQSVYCKEIQKKWKDAYDTLRATKYKNLACHIFHTEQKGNTGFESNDRAQACKGVLDHWNKMQAKLEKNKCVRRETNIFRM